MQFHHRLARAISRASFPIAAACLLGMAAAPAIADDAASLRSRYTELQGELATNAYQRPIFIESGEADRTLRGDVYAVLDHPFSRVSQGMDDAAEWCDIMILPFNTKYCHAIGEGADSHLAVRIGRKYDQPVEQAFRIDFAFQKVAASSGFYEARLSAKEGPVGTRDYRITMSAIPLDASRTFMHLTYSYGYGTAGRIAMQAYLATAGADKVGFSMAGRDANGRPQLVGGVRGATERNVMRYYLAIDAYLDSLTLPKGQQVERRIQSWFSATEQYARQLHEMDRNTYVNMKRTEYERQQSVALR